MGQFGKILYLGEPIRMRVGFVDTKMRGNRAVLSEREIIVRRASETQTLAVRGLENWLRGQSRSANADNLRAVMARIGEVPERVYVVGQRTKGGICSSRTIRRSSD